MQMSQLIWAQIKFFIGFNTPVKMLHIILAQVLTHTNTVIFYLFLISEILKKCLPRHNEAFK